MIKLPERVSTAYNHFMARRGVPSKQQPHFRKWLLYYVDFCHKYGHSYDTASSLDAFLVKLQEKKQSTIFRQQAQEAIALYFEMLGSRKTPSQTDQNKIADTQTMASIPNRQEIIRSETQPTAKSWVWIYAKPEEQIRVRHYSDKTLKSYRELKGQYTYLSCTFC